MRGVFLGRGRHRRTHAALGGGHPQVRAARRRGLSGDPGAERQGGEQRGGSQAKARPHRQTLLARSSSIPELAAPDASHGGAPAAAQNRTITSNASVN
jgi:hypothetical protein